MRKFCFQVSSWDIFLFADEKQVFLSTQVWPPAKQKTRALIQPLAFAEPWIPCHHAPEKKHCSSAITVIWNDWRKDFYILYQSVVYLCVHMCTSTASFHQNVSVRRLCGLGKFGGLGHILRRRRCPASGLPWWEIRAYNQSNSSKEKPLMSLTKKKMRHKTVV